MAIRIVRNTEGNCINFYGSSNPVYFNACLSGEVDATDNTLVNVKNDIKTAQNGETQYEFYQLSYTEFVDEDGNPFNNAQETADYITLKGNVLIGQGLEYKGIWDASTNTPDITTDTTNFVAGDFYKTITEGSHDLGSGSIDFVNGDEVIFDGNEWQHKPYGGALVEYDSTRILLNNNPAVYADGAQGLEEPNNTEDGWYFTNDEAGKKINWYFLGNQNDAYQITKSSLKGAYARIKFIKNEYVFFTMYTTPKGDGFDRFWFRSRYSYSNGDFSGITEGEEILLFWGEEPNVFPELTRVELTLDSYASLISEAPDVSNDDVYTMALSTDSASGVDEVEFIAKELGFKNGQYTSKFILEAKLENNVVEVNPDKDLNGELVDFKLDATSTSIMLDNGYSFGVNTIKAVANTDGTIHIVSEQGNLEHFTTLSHTNVSIDGVSISGGLQDVVNTLNELFTVGAFESVIITDPYSTMVANVSGSTVVGSLVGDGINPAGNDVGGSTTTGYNHGGYKSNDTINQAGEYFTFDIRVEGIIGMGLVNIDEEQIFGNTTYGNPANFCSGVGNGHYGFQFSHWFHPSPNGPWTNYGANTSYVMGAGWSNVSKRFSSNDEGQEWLDGNPIKMRVGIDENAFISVDYYDVSESTWIMISRTSYPVVEGNEYQLGIKFGDTKTRLFSTPKIHELEELAPTMNFRYVESPDDNFIYPIFATEEEANYYDEQNGGSGTSDANVFPDEPTFTTWYTPTNGLTDDGTTAPTSEDFLGNTAVYTEITTLTNGDLAPTAFSDTTITVNELSSVNIQVVPQDSSFTTTISGLDGIALVGNNIEGTAPEVAGDNVSNPSDSYDITITRTNSYGSSQGTLTIVVNNLTLPEETIDGFQNHQGSIVDGLMQPNSLYQLQHKNEELEDGKRLVIRKEWVEDNILPYILASGDSYVIGFLNSGANTTTLDVGDFDFVMEFTYNSSTSHRVKFIRDGVVGVNYVVNSMTQAFYDYAIEIDGNDAWMIGCNLNNIMTEASPSAGGTFTNTYQVVGYDTDGGDAHTHFGVISMEGGLDEGDTDLTTIDTPIIVATTTPFSKTLDFSGSNEHAKQVSTSNSVNALRMNGLSQLATANTDNSKTSNHSYSRPWATAIVFKSDFNSSNQHIWNSGDGTGSTDDNVYLRTDANGLLYFGWGRQGALNECRLGGQAITGWRAVYIAHKGTRLSGNDATATNLANAFDIRVVNPNNNWDLTYVYNVSTPANWITTGGRMDRAILGDFTIGGRGSNRNFHGKVASMVITTLKRGDTMPDSTEIQEMITNPKKWEEDYKINQTARNGYNGSNFTYTGTNGQYATQIWLMGDGTLDSYANGIRNQVNPSNQNDTKLQLNNMVSNDIENVNISGLT